MCSTLDTRPQTRLLPRSSETSVSSPRLNHAQKYQRGLISTAGTTAMTSHLKGDGYIEPTSSEIQ